MSLWSEVRQRVDAVLNRQRRERETEEEIAFHLSEQARALELLGESPDEARRQARVAFGSRETVREDVRSARGTAWLDTLRADAFYAFRQIRRSPGFAGTVIATLALGIGASAAIYGVVDRVLLRPVPFDDAERIVVVWETDRRSGTSREPASWPDIMDFQSRAKTLAASAALIGSDMSLTSPQAPPVRLTGIATTASYFTLTGVRPLLGRPFAAEETQPGGPKVALLGESLWRSRFGSDPRVVGQTVRVDDVQYEIVGVLPAGADFGIDQINEHAAYHAPYSGEGEAGVWLPLQATAEEFPRDTHPFFLLGRIAPGATVPTARTELTAIAEDLERTYASANAGRGVNVEGLGDVVFGSSRPLLYLLLAAVGLLLLVAFVNVANLLLARGATRIREIAIRSALGATAPRVGRQLLIESLMLGLIGGALGVVAASAALKFLLALAPANIPRLADVAIDARLTLFSLAGALAVGVAFGSVPMWQARRVDVVHALKGQTTANAAAGRRHSAREVLVVVALALSVTLSISAGLLVRSFRNLMDADPGFQAAAIMKAEYQLPASRYPRDFSKWPKFPEIHGFSATLLERARAIPGVSNVALAGAHPLDAGFTNSWTIVGREGESRDFPEISVRIVSPEYFVTVGGGLVRGRLLTDADDGEAPTTAVINETAARRFFATSEAIGARISFWGIPRTIVGVVRDEKIHGLREAVPPAVYVPFAQAPSSSGVLLARSTVNSATLGAELQRVIWSVDPQLAVYGVEPFTRTVLRSVAANRFAMLVLSLFAIVTVLLALIGVHGVVSYLATQRTKEIGIRVALGAGRGAVTGLVVRSGMVLGAVGVTAGLAGGWALTKLLATLLFGVTRADMVSFTLVAVVMFAAATLSAYLPARRAARTSPLIAIRSD